MDHAAYDICTMKCPAGLIPDPIDEISCNRWTGFYLNSGTNITCETPPETDCGYLKDSFTIADNVTATCDEATGQCIFSCPADTDYLETSIVQCSDGNKDTACGDVEIEGHTSTEACADNTCNFTCA